MYAMGRNIIYHLILKVTSDYCLWGICIRHKYLHWLNIYINFNRNSVESICHFELSICYSHTHTIITSIIVIIVRHKLIVTIAAIITNLCMNGLSPSYIKDLFEIYTNSYDLRDNKKLVQPPVKTTLYGLRTIRYYGVHIRNMLPVQCKDCADVHDFRILLLTWYGPNCSCSVCMQARRWNIIIFSFYLYHMFIVTCKSPLYTYAQCFIYMSFL